MFGITQKKIERWKSAYKVSKLEKAVREAEEYPLRIQALEALAEIGATEGLVTVVKAFHDPVRHVAQAATKAALRLSNNASIAQAVAQLETEWQQFDTNLEKHKAEVAEKAKADYEAYLRSRAQEMRIREDMKHEGIQPRNDGPDILGSILDNI